MPSRQVEVWRTVPRTNGFDSIAYHRSIWAQEVSIHGYIPARALGTPLAPMSQVSIFPPVIHATAVGANSFDDD